MTWKRSRGARAITAPHRDDAAALLRSAEALEAFAALRHAGLAWRDPAKVEEAAEAHAEAQEAARSARRRALLPALRALVPLLRAEDGRAAAAARAHALLAARAGRASAGRRLRRAGCALRSLRRAAAAGGQRPEPGRRNHRVRARHNPPLRARAVAEGRKTLWRRAPAHGRHDLLWCESATSF